MAKATTKPSESQPDDSRLAEAALHIFTQRTIQQPSLTAEHHAKQAIAAAEVFLAMFDERGADK